MRLRYSAQVRAHIAEIHRYIRERNPIATTRDQAAPHVGSESETMLP
jgi:hypothetical protein